MQIVRKKISDMERATYNPRIDLIPGDMEYENLRRSIKTYGMIIPVVWNERTNRVVGGHQRLTVLENEGETEVDVSVVDLDETQERQLNVALNKVEGGWDNDKLAELRNWERTQPSRDLRSRKSTASQMTLTVLSTETP